MIGHSLDDALRWVDAVHVLDNGSTDGTWELLEEYAAREPRIVLAGRHEEQPFRDGIRALAVQDVLADAEPGDWWARVDADEFAIDDPREILAGVAPELDVVHGVFVEYFFTEVELRAWEVDADAYLAGWTPQTLRHYLAMWAEIRFVRHRPGVPWRSSWPVGSREAPAAPERVRFRHLQYRSPPQIERRVRARVESTVEGSFEHEKADPWSATGRPEDLYFREPAPEDPLWKRRVMRSDSLHFDAGDGVYVIEC